jgi:hypothetical protein
MSSTPKLTWDGREHDDAIAKKLRKTISKWRVQLGFSLFLFIPNTNTRPYKIAVYWSLSQEIVKLLPRTCLERLADYY